MTGGDNARARPQRIRWTILLIEILLLAGLGFGGSTLLFSLVPLTSSAIVIVLTLVTFPLARRLHAQTHIIIVFHWIADSVIDQ